MSDIKEAKISRFSCVQFVYIRFSYIIYYRAHNLINDKLVDLIERIFQMEGSLYIACNNKNAFFTSDAVRIIIYGLVRTCVKLSAFS